jgi:hypothetical protein
MNISMANLLPVACWERILTYAPSLSMCLVCRQFLCARQAPSARLCSNVLDALGQIRSLLVAPCSGGGGRGSAHAEKRVQFLTETLELLVALVSKMEPTHVPHIHHLLGSLLVCLQETVGVLKQVRQGTFCKETFWLFVSI